jgi:hypothetical protein
MEMNDEFFSSYARIEEMLKVFPSFESGYVNLPEGGFRTVREELQRLGALMNAEVVEELWRKVCATERVEEAAGRSTVEVMVV